MARAILYGFWASSCTWRVRAALHLKRIPYEEKPVDIAVDNNHLTEEYRVLNPAQKVPTLIIDGVTVIESMAIIQYLEDTRPDPPLMPDNPVLRARIRQICETVVSGIQPLQNIALRQNFATEKQFLDFSKHWIERGLQTLEALLQESNGRYCVGDKLSIADLCLVPQLNNAVTRHKIDLRPYKKIAKLFDSLLQEEAIRETHPTKVKAGTPKAIKNKL